MDQISINFTAPIQQRGSIRSRHASTEGAGAVKERVARQMLIVLMAYKTHGALNDAEVETITGIQRSSVIPRRWALLRAGLIQEIGHRVNVKSGKSNTAYGINQQGAGE